jgi:hypothetical protein
MTILFSGVGGVEQHFAVENRKVWAMSPSEANQEMT